MVNYTDTFQCRVMMLMQVLLLVMLHCACAVYGQENENPVLRTPTIITANETETTVEEGGTAILHCVVDNLNTETVIWMTSDFSILTVGRLTYVRDSRYQVMHHDKDWALQIRDVSKNDVGTYKCQVSTRPPTSVFVKLLVEKSYAEIQGLPDKYVKVGDTLNLTCSLKMSRKRQYYIFWYHSDEVINYDSNRRVIVTEDGMTSTLTITRVDMSHSGKYTCVMSHADPVSVIVHIELDDTGALRFWGNSRHSELFRVMLVDSDSLLLGGRNGVYSINMHDFLENQRINWSPSSGDRLSCLTKGGTEAQCGNFIRVLKKTSNDTFVICGTNAYNPICKEFKKTVNGNYEMIEEYSGRGYCPFDPQQTFTSVYTDGALYAGTVGDFVGVIPLIHGRDLRTLQYNPKHLNDPDFVSSLPFEDQVLFFFTENGTECSNCSSNIYSRVARVCKNDKGGGGRFRNQWTSFFKSTLNCIANEYSDVSFNKIQSTSEITVGLYGRDESDSVIYGVFTSDAGSAVCAFEMNSLMQTFLGPFKNNDTETPEPHPGLCMNDSRDISDETLRFVNSHPLMESEVAPFKGTPQLSLTSASYQFTKIAVDPQIQCTDGKSYDVMFIGTDNGRVVKAVNTCAPGGGVCTVVVENIQVLQPGESINNMKLVRSGEEPKLVILSDNEVVAIPVQRCNQKAKTCRECVALRDPYCAWNTTSMQCEPMDYPSEIYLQNVQQGNSSNCLPYDLGGNRFHGSPMHNELFRVMLLDSESILLGGRNSVYNISIHDLTENQRIVWGPSPDRKSVCLMKGKSEAECDNYIRVLKKISNETLLICGTNAYSPTCKEFKMSPTGSYRLLKEYDGRGYCPYDPLHRSTSVYSDGALYAGTVADFSAYNALIYGKGLRTLPYDLKQLNNPRFVSSLPYSDYILFFFRENAAECENCSNDVYSRVAKVCKDDMGGGTRRFKRQWTSFLKSTLNCSTNEDLDVIYNEIESTSEVIVGQYGGNNTDAIIYGVFTSDAGSAVCAFRMSSLMETFRGPFKDYEREPPAPHPGLCVNDSSTISDDTLRFVNMHPLMEAEVPLFQGKPQLSVVSKRYQFTQIAIDAQVDSAEGTAYDVIFVGTDTGRVVKAVNTCAPRGTVCTVVLEDIQVLQPGETIQHMSLVRSDGEPKLVVSSDNELVSIPVQRCNRNAKTCRECIGLQDPYCAWNTEQMRCEGSLHHGLNYTYLQDGNSSICLPDGDDDEGDGLTEAQTNSTVETYATVESQLDLSNFTTAN